MDQAATLSSLQKVDDMSTGQVDVVMGRRYSQVQAFRLEQ